LIEIKSAAEDGSHARHCAGLPTYAGLPGRKAACNLPLPGRLPARGHPGEPRGM
jgi:hypothetical protein